MAVVTKNVITQILQSLYNFISNINQNRRLLKFFIKKYQFFDEIFDFMLVTKNYY